jgi:hypothetical protein
MTILSEAAAQAHWVARSYADSPHRFASGNCKLRPVMVFHSKIHGHFEGTQRPEYKEQPVSKNPFCTMMHICSPCCGVVNCTAFRSYIFSMFSRCWLSWRCIKYHGDSPLFCANAGLAYMTVWLCQHSRFFPLFYFWVAPDIICLVPDFFIMFLAVTIEGND